MYFYDPYNFPSNYPIQGELIQIQPIMAPNQPIVPVPVTKKTGVASPVTNIHGVAVPVTNIPQVQVVGPQFRGVQYVYVEDPLLELENCTEALIKQRPEFFESISGCELPNLYHVFGFTSQGYKYLFQCRERSEFCARCCCPSNIREFNMNIFHAVTTGFNLNAKKFANIFKPLKCPCCCCNRPVIHINLGENDTPIGKIIHSFSFCDPEFQVFKPNGDLKYFVHADCCQCGLICANNLCGKYSPAHFHIYDAGTNNLVAKITKMCAQSYAEVLTDADSYNVSFPKEATSYDKLLIIALGLMIDYQYFETNANNDKRF